jgi:hypothetical protein
MRSRPPSQQVERGLVTVVAAVLAFAAAWSLTQPHGVTAAPAGHRAQAARNSVYVYYYLWWTRQHWRAKLGRSYPYRSRSLPTPGSMDAGVCNPRVRFPGSEIVDIPREGLYDQDLPRTFDRHIAQAANAGLRGFLLSWQGTGRTRQSPSSSGHNRRLDSMVARVRAYNSSHGTRFRLGLAYEAFGRYDRPASELINDLRYFSSRYGSLPVFESSFSSKPMVMLLGSRKYIPAVGAPGAVLPHVFHALGRSLYLVGDETYRSYPADAPYLHASSYYWSSQDPWRNSGARSQIASLGAQIHADGKPWFAPVIAGFNMQLVGGQSCVPRRGLETLHEVWAMNNASNPDAWFAISWNEFVENTYFQPSANHGSRYLDALGRLAANG